MSTTAQMLLELSSEEREVGIPMPCSYIDGYHLNFMSRRGIWIFFQSDLCLIYSVFMSTRNTRGPNLESNNVFIVILFSNTIDFIS